MSRTSRSVLLLVVGALVLTMLAMAAPASAKKSPFTGSWENEDYDGSHQHVTFSNPRGGRYHYRDDGARDGACPGGAESEAFTSMGTYAVLSSTEIRISGPAFCHYRGKGGRTPWPWGPFEPTFTYDPVSDTLSDDAQPPNCWYRSGSDPSVCDE
jgi:hypothetical protein